MKIIDITPTLLKSTNWKTKTFLSDQGVAYTTWNTGTTPIQHDGLFLFPKHPGNGGSGYKSIKLAKREVMLHRLVAQNFIPNPEHKPVVNHKDGNKENNHVDNLEWVTYAENTQHAVDTGLIVKAGRTELWCNACNHSPVSIWCNEEFEDHRVQWKKHRDIVRRKVS
jgi:hypothetical protein